MYSFEELTYSITCRYSDRIKKACAPLFEYFHLSHFGYFKITEDGGYRYFGSHVEWSEYFAAEKLYMYFPYYRHPKLLQTGVYFMTASKKGHVSDLIDIARNRFGIYHKLFIFKPLDRGVEGYCFATDSGEVPLAAHLLNELPLLQRFLVKFREENKFLFSLAEERQANLIKLMGQVFNQRGEDFDGTRSRALLLKRLGIEEAKLSQMERSVVKLVKDGYSAREIGLRLFRSKRTIEHTIEKLKEKLVCDSKGALMRKIKELEEFA
jgi:DNA-binding CsgD family transcriptional regulator